VRLARLEKLQQRAPLKQQVLAQLKVPMKAMNKQPMDVKQVAH